MDVYPQGVESGKFIGAPLPASDCAIFMGCDRRLQAAYSDLQSIRDEKTGFHDIYCNYPPHGTVAPCKLKDLTRHPVDSVRFTQLAKQPGGDGFMFRH
jgi:hypothetical protein